jgi:hypothetical protein
MSQASEFSANVSTVDQQLPPNSKEAAIIMAFFTFNSTEDRSYCIRCDKSYSKKNTGNMKRHLLDKHKEEALNRGINEVITSKRARSGNDDEPTAKIQKMDRCTFALLCVQMIIERNEPFSAFDTSGPLRQLISMHEAFTGLTMSPENVRQHVQKTAAEVRRFITREVSETMVSIQVDVGTRNNRNFLGISCQFFSLTEKRIVVRTLGVIALTESHTSENMKGVILRTLSSFGIKTSQLIAHNSDNAANAIACGVRLRQQQASDIDAMHLDDDENFYDDIDDAEEIQTLATLRDAIYSIDSVMTPMRCFLHSLQLAVHDTLNSMGPEKKALLSKIRKVVKNVKSSTFIQQVRQLGIKNLPLDTVTRWGSSFKMFESLMNQETNLRKLHQLVEEKHKKDVGLSEDSWSLASSIVQAMKPAYILTIELQAVNLSLGEVLSILSK